MSYFIYPYMKGSRSARLLRDELNGKLIKLNNSRYRKRNNHIVINYGNSHTPEWMVGDDNVLNKPNQVRLASNKLRCFNTLQSSDVSTVPFTDDWVVASDWLNSGDKVYVRHTLDGHSGEGIEVLEGSQRDEGAMFAVQEAQRILDEAGLEDVSDTLDNEYNRLAEEEHHELPEAPLYTKGLSYNGEYRVHVFNGEVILYQKKSRRYLDEDTVDGPTDEQADIRNLGSGWVYRTGHLKRLERIEQLALSAIEALGLDFGAVDIIMDDSGEVYVLEVNTAPGLGNTQTLDAYVDAFND